MCKDITSKGDKQKKNQNTYNAPNHKGSINLEMYSSKA